jgi:hypothetical protein
MILAILASLVLWPLYLGVSLLLDLVGLGIILPLAMWHESLPFLNMRPSKVYPDGRLVEVWAGGWLTWLWGNEEDGVAGPTWWLQRNNVYVKAGYWRRVWSTYRWSALRNPSNNLRFVPLINPVIRPAAIGYYGASVLGLLFTFTWQGVYAGVIAFPRIKGRTYRFWLGWKLKPEDAHGLPPNDMRAPRCGWATQFKRVG